jgi:hypothetical protein
MIKPLLTIIFLILFCIPVFAKTDGKTGFAVAPDESVFLLLPNKENKIVKYDNKGILLKQFGEEGPGAGQLLVPLDILIHKDRLFVLDKFGPQVKVYSLSGKFQYEFGKKLPTDQTMKNPLMMRVFHDKPNKRDLLYILDIEKKMILKFLLTGEFFESYGIPVDDDDIFPWITSFDVDPMGNVWFLMDSYQDTAFRHILKYDETGQKLMDYPMGKMGGDGYLSDIHVYETGDYYLADGSYGTNTGMRGQIILMDAQNQPQKEKEIYDWKDQKYYSPKRFSLAAGFMYVLSSDDILLKLDPSYKVIDKWSLK